MLKHTKDLEELKSFLINHCDELISILPKRWAQIGFFNKQTEIEIKKTLLVNLFQNWKSAMEKQCDEIEENVKTFDSRVSQLCQLLKLDFEVARREFYDSCCTSSPTDFSTLTILEKSTHMEKLIQHLSTIKEQRISKFHSLQKQSQTHLSTLNMEHRQEMWFINEEENLERLRKSSSGSPNPDYIYIPSETCILDFEKYVAELIQKIENRNELLKRCQGNYIDVLAKLGEMPEAGEFEHSFLYLAEFNDLGDSFIENCRRAEDRINKKLKEREDSMKAMAQRIYFIITKLGLKYEGLLNENAYRGPSPNSSSSSTDIEEVFILPDLETYTEENHNDIKSLLSKLERIKLEKLDEIIEKTHKQLRFLNEQAYLSELEILRFNKQTLGPLGPKGNNPNKEELLKKMEIRVEYLENYVSQNGDFFSLLDKWNIAFTDLKEIEDQQKDPNRLKSNRGGALLKENKRKQAIERKLRTSEEQLLAIGEAKGNDCPKLKGMDIYEYIDTENQIYQEEKELERKGRKLEKQKTMYHESIFGASSFMPSSMSTKRLPPGGATGSAKKRAKNSSKVRDTSKTSSTNSNNTASTLSTAASSGFRRPLSSRPNSRPPSAKSTPMNSREPTPSKTSSHITHTPSFGKENQLPNSNSRTGRSTQRAAVGAGLKPGGLKPSSANRKLASKKSKPIHVVEAEKIKRQINRRRSRTPETLFREKTGSSIKFKELPSHRAKTRNGFGFNPAAGLRRRSKSHGQLDNIVEEFSNRELMSESIVSGEDFQDYILTKSADRNNKYLSSSFVSHEI